MAFLEMIVPQKFTNQSGLIPVPNLRAGLLIDLSADSATADAGGVITSWADTTGTITLVAATGAGTTRPTLVDDAVNGHKAARFGGAHSIASGTSTEILPIGAPGTIAVVYRDAGDGDANGRLVVSERSTEQFRWLRNSTGRFQAGANGGGSFQSSVTPSSTVGKWVVGIAAFGESSVTLKTSLGDTATSSMVPGDLSGILLGSSVAGTDKFSGDIARVMVWDHALMGEELDSTMSILMDGYGIASAT